MGLVFWPTVRDPTAQSEGLGRSLHLITFFGLKGRDCGPSDRALASRPFRSKSYLVEMNDGCENSSSLEAKQPQTLFRKFY